MPDQGPLEAIVRTVLSCTRTSRAYLYDHWRGSGKTRLMVATLAMCGFEAGSKTQAHGVHAYQHSSLAERKLLDLLLLDSAAA